MEKCRVIGCDNSSTTEILRAKEYGIYGFCQIHTLERIRIKEEVEEDDGC